MFLTPDNSSLFVATTSSAIKCWPVNNRVVHSRESSSPEEEDEENPKPLFASPEWTIKGGSSIRSFAVLNDKRHVLTKDTQDNVVLWDILKVRSALFYY